MTSLCCHETAQVGETTMTVWEMLADRNALGSLVPPCVCVYAGLPMAFCKAMPPSYAACPPLSGVMLSDARPRHGVLQWLQPSPHWCFFSAPHRYVSCLALAPRKHLSLGWAKLEASQVPIFVQAQPPHQEPFLHFTSYSPLGCGASMCGEKKVHPSTPGAACPASKARSGVLEDRHRSA